MGNIQLIKGAVNLVVGAGSGMIVSNVVKATTPQNINKISKVCIGVGSFVISSIVSDKATEYAEQKITDAVNSIKNNIGDKILTEDEIEEEA